MENKETDDEYFKIALLHTLHRIYELQVQIAKAAGIQQDTLEEMVESHLKHDYEVPFLW